MRKIAIMNHKGGVGKTTTAINLAAGLSRQGRKVLLVDLDPQGNVKVSLNTEAYNTIFDALTGRATIKECIVPLAKNFDVIISNEELTKSEDYLRQTYRLQLAEVMQDIKDYDYLIIDCPPSIGLVTQNVLVFTDEVFIPTSTDYLGYDALMKMLVVVSEVNEAYGAKTNISMIIPTMYDKRNKICRDTLDDIKLKFSEMTTEPIRVNSKLMEAPKAGMSIFNYDKSSRGAKDYWRLVESVIAAEAFALMPEEKIKTEGF